MQLPFAPEDFLRTRVRKRLQCRFVPFGKNLEGHLAGRSVNPVSGFAQKPIHELPVGVLQVAELPQWQEGALHVADPTLHPALVPWHPWAAGDDLEAVQPCKLRVATLHFGVPMAGLRDGGLQVVDDDLLGHPSEELEGVTVAAQPRAHLLVPDHLSVHVAAVA